MNDHVVMRLAPARMIEIEDESTGHKILLRTVSMPRIANMAIQMQASVDLRARRSPAE